LQKDTLVRHSNLFKPNVLVTSSGYILVPKGLYFTYNGVTDAEMSKKMLQRVNNDCIEKNAVLILAHGFLDSMRRQVSRLSSDRKSATG